jgi:hypothetical protein
VNETPETKQTGWEQWLQILLPLYGHRNWIVVADAAYPAQSRNGIETVVTDAGQMEVVTKVLEAIRACRHIRANVYMDRELDFVAEDAAPGVAEYREKLAGLLAAQKTVLPHEEIIAKLDKTAQLFRVLILKTTMTIPYTSVFFELDCGYWTEAAEKQLRQRMAAAGAQ